MLNIPSPFGIRSPFGQRRVLAPTDLPTLPPGWVFLVDAIGNYLTDGGAYLIAQEA